MLSSTGQAGAEGVSLCRALTPPPPREGTADVLGRGSIIRVLTVSDYQWESTRWTTKSFVRPVNRTVNS